MLTFQKYYCLDSIRNFFAPKRNRKTIMGCASLSLLQHHARWIREMTDGRLESGQEIQLRSDVYWLLCTITFAFQCQILTTKMEISTFTFNAVALIVLCIGTGFLFVPVCRGKAKWSLKVSLKLSNLIFSAFATRKTETSVSSPRTLKVYLLTTKHKGSP